MSTDVDELKARLKKLNARATQAKMDLHDLSEELPTNWESILQPHIEGSEARMAQHPVVLCLQDTTELDFDGQETEGLGPLSYEAQRGMYLHPTYAVTPQREPLGSSMPGCGHVSPKAPTERAQGFPRARAGSKVTSGLRRRRQRCGARDGSMWRIAKPTWWA